MKRKATKKSTRAQNADEKRFMLWCVEHDCIECGNYGVIIDHGEGSAFIHNKVLIGHWYILPLCPDCDSVKTQGSHNAYRERFGRTQAEAWQELILDYPGAIPREVQLSIIDWNR